jgi:integrase
MKYHTDKILNEYLDRNLRAATRRHYRICMERYQTSTGLSCKELLEEAEMEEDTAVRLRSRKIKKYLRNHQKYLEDKGSTPESVKINLSVVRSFYKFFDIQLPSQRNKYQKGITITTEDLPGREDIKKALKFSNIKYQAIILTMASSAMGAGEVLSLKVKDLIKGLEDNVSLDNNGNLDFNETKRKIGLKENNVVTWQVTRQKTGYKYITFSTPEALEAILNYLESHPPSSNEDYIFRPRINKRMVTKSLIEYFRKLNKRCGWDKVGKQAFFRSHHLRKFWANQMEKRALGYMNSRILMGHTGESIRDSTGAAYFKPDPNHLRHLYIQSMEAVMINWKMKVKMVTDKKIEKMEKKIQELEEEAEKRNKLLDSIMSNPKVLRELQVQK